MRRNRMHIRTLGFAAAASLAAALPAAAQEHADTIRLEPVVVTAARVPTPISAAPGTVTLITRQELQQRGVRLVADALRLVPGVAVVQSAGPGALTSVFMRGGESDYVQVLVDGVQVNDPGGAYDWAHLRAEDIDRIEVVRGPASVLYGSDAVSGVVQIFTRAGGAPRIEAGASSRRGARHAAPGAFTTHAADVSLTGATAVQRLQQGALAWGVSASHLRSSGLYAFNSDYDNTLASGRVQLTAAAGDIALTARATDNEYHYPTSGSGAVVDVNQFATGRALSFGADAGRRVTRSVELRLLATSHRNDTRTDNPPDSEADGSFWSTAEQTRRRLDARLNWTPVRDFVVTTGVEREWQWAGTVLESVSEWGEFTDASDESRRTTAVYGQLHGTPARGVSATAGARRDDNSAFGTFTTGRAALSWAAAGGVRLHASAGTAFKEPTFFENFAAGYTRGNPDLQPEEARSWEAGAEYSAADGALTLSATRFDQRFRNLIQYTFATPTPTAPNYGNIGAARAHGLELGLHARSAFASLALTHTLTRTRVTDAGFGSDAAFQQDRRLLRRPEQQSTASLLVAAPRGSRIGLDVRRVGERDDLDFTVPGEWSGVRTLLPAYSVADLGIEAPLLRSGARSADISVRVRNLGNARYAEIHNFPAPGRVLEAGVRAGAGLVRR
jgi:vitamin B12 transporter